MHIAFIDLETTGVDLEKDRIVQIGATKTEPDLKTIIDKRTILINPGIPIPAGATAVHGITDEMVHGQPFFKQIAKSLFGWLDGCELGGFNITNFDIPLLSEEFDRAGIVWPAAGRRPLIFDSCRIYHDREKRDLSAAAKFYCDIDHTDAHDAGADVSVTIDILAAQLLFYPDLKSMSLQELSKLSLPDNRIDLAGKLELNEQGVPVYAFGKDRGKSIRENIGFANWMLKQPFPADTKRHLRKILGWSK